MNGLRSTFPLGLAGGWLLAALAVAALVPAQAQMPVVRFDVARFVVEGDNPLSEARTREVLGAFTGEHAGVEGLLAAADALERAMQEVGFPFQRVVVPPQSLNDGEVVLRVAVFKVAQVEVRGARHHSEANARRSVPALREGKTPDTGAVARSLALANRQPWKTTTVTFRESDSVPQGLDAVLEVEDRRPWTVWSSLDNTGSGSTGPFRWSVGASAGNLFDRDHTLNASYVTSPGHAGRIRQWAVGYSAPAYGLGGAFTGFHVRSEADSGRVLDAFDVSGAGAFTGVLYTHELAGRAGLTHRLSAGLDDRHFDNDLVPAGARSGAVMDLAPPAVRSRPLVLGYAAEYAEEDWSLESWVRYARNLRSGSGNDDAVYEANRPGAEAGWDALRGGARLSWALPARWSARGVLEGQMAGEALIAGEQFGLGGVNSVRGFSEREVAGDDGIRGSLELWSPTVADTGVRFLLFADAGRVFSDALSGVPGGDTADSLASLGAGLRWSWKEQVALLLDVGAILEGTETREHGAHGHLSLLVRY